MLENAYLLEGLFRWNADHPSAAVSTDLSTEPKTFSGVLDLVELSPTQLFNSIILSCTSTLFPENCSSQSLARDLTH